MRDSPGEMDRSVAKTVGGMERMGTVRSASALDLLSARVQPLCIAPETLGAFPIASVLETGPA